MHFNVWYTLRTPQRTAECAAQNNPIQVRNLQDLLVKMIPIIPIATNNNVGLEMIGIRAELVPEIEAVATLRERAALAEMIKESEELDGSLERQAEDANEEAVQLAKDKDAPNPEE